MKHFIPSLNFIKASILFIFIAVLSSCGSTKNIVYFQDVENINAQDSARIVKNTPLTIVPNDNLHIAVSSTSPEAADLFNRGVNQTTQTPTSLSIQGYLVNEKGEIKFPVIGTIQVGGLTKEEAEALIKEKISAYIVDPVVNIRFLNFKVSVMGEVNRPGSLTINDERLTVAEALSMAGDMTIYGERKNVLVVREQDGKREFARLNMTSPEVFSSPYYYLQQNDVVYVQPNRTKAGVSTYNQNLPLGLSLLSTLITIIVLVTR